MKKIIGGFLAVAWLLAGYWPLVNMVIPAQAAGATLFVSPATGSYSVGDTFTVKIMVNSGGGSGINAAEGAIKFDPTGLKVNSITKGSVFSLWTEEPTFSNGSGKISFGGGSPTAYKGTAGTIASVSFSVLKAGSADLTFTSGLVLANDGQGTNILSSYGSGNYTIAEAVKKEPTPTETKQTTTETGNKDTTTKKEDDKEKGILPPAPELVSTTHPKEDEWYSDNKPEFKWKLLADVIAVSILTTKSSSSDPGTDSDGIIESKSFDAMADGQWYVHVKFKNKYGWSQISHKKFMIDTQPPKPFEISVNNQGDSTNPLPIINFATTDETSGVDHYKVNIDNENKEVKAEDVQPDAYHWTPLAPGEHNISVQAIDKAGNIASSSAKFIVDALKMPIVSDMPKTLVSSKEDLIIRGSSFYPETTIYVYIAKPNKDPEVFQVKTDADGNWSFFSNKKYDNGNYEVWVSLTDARGASSYPTSKNILVITSPSILQSYGWYIIAVLSLMFMGALLTIWYLLKKFSEERLRIKRETRETKNVVAKVFTALKEELDEQMEYADKKKGLSESERRVKERLQEAFDVAQEFISKEIDDAEKEINIKKKER